MADGKTVQIAPEIEIAEMQLRMQAQIEFLTNRVLVLSQLLTDTRAALEEAQQTITACQEEQSGRAE